jgi:hypothetical protein
MIEAGRGPTEWLVGSAAVVHVAELSIARVCTRVVPRAFWVCAQSAVLYQNSAFSEKAHYLLFWLAELRPRCKTVENVALSKKPPSTATPKESTQGKLNPALRHDVLKRSSIALQLAQSATNAD